MCKEPTDRLVPKALGSHLVNELTDQRWRGSSSLAKKIDAWRTISSASSRSRTLLFRGYPFTRRILRRVPIKQIENHAYRTIPLIYRISSWYRNHLPSQTRKRQESPNGSLAPPFATLHVKIPTAETIIIRGTPWQLGQK